MHKTNIEKGKIGHEDFVSFLAKKKEIIEQTIPNNESSI